MSAGIPLAWRQLAMEKKRTAAATTGILFAVVMMLVQLRFPGCADDQRGGAFPGAPLRSPAGLAAIPVPPPGKSISRTASLSSRGRCCRGHSIAPVYVAAMPWKNPESGKQRMILVLGVRRTIALPAIDRKIAELENPDLILFDAKGREDYGPVPEMMRRGRRVETEVANRRVTVAGLFEIGTSFTRKTAL